MTRTLTPTTDGTDFKKPQGWREQRAQKNELFQVLSSFGELQLLTLQRNAGFTASHPYASSPINWPFLEWNQLLDGERFAETDLPAW
jgi:dolichyl-phosphate-mannose-protein mannosyltransferase